MLKCIPRARTRPAPSLPCLRIDLTVDFWGPHCGAAPHRVCGQHAVSLCGVIRPGIIARPGHGLSWSGNRSWELAKVWG